MMIHTLFSRCQNNNGIGALHLKRLSNVNNRLVSRYTVTTHNRFIDKWTKRTMKMSFSQSPPEYTRKAMNDFFVSIHDR